MIEITSNELYNEYLEYRSRLDVWKKNHGIFIKDIQKLERTVDALLNERLDELIITHRKFITILNQQGSSAKKIGVLKLKNIQTNMQMHEYYKEPSLNAWFNWQGFKFLRWYSDYGTNPFKALTYCFWTMLYFALFYFFCTH